MKNLSAEEFKTAIESDPNAIIIDVRNPEEEVEGRIEKSININIQSPSFQSKVFDLDKSKNYYVFCRSGGRSGQACLYMNNLGLTTFNLNGGIIAWNQL